MTPYEHEWMGDHTRSVAPVTAPPRKPSGGERKPSGKERGPGPVPPPPVDHAGAGGRERLWRRGPASPDRLGVRAMPDAGNTASHPPVMLGVVVIFACSWLIYEARGSGLAGVVISLLGGASPADNG